MKEETNNTNTVSNEKKEETSSVNNQTVKQTTPPAPAAPATVIAPNQTEFNPQEAVINTKKETTSSKVFFIVVLLVGLFVYFLDDIVDYFTEDNYQYIYGDSTNYESGNLVDGFIKFGENSSFIKVKKIRFYNFLKSSDTSIVLNYESSANVSDSSSLEIYILIYDSNKELIYKELFNTTEKIEKDAIRQYSMKVKNDVYQSAFYAKVLIFDKTQKNLISNVKCKYVLNKDDFDVNYQIVYSFKNDELIAYEVTKEYKVKNDKANIDEYKTEIKLEYLKVNDAKMANKYEDNYLNYKVDVTKLQEGFTPLYTIGTLPKTIKNAESLKNWVCE